MPLFLSAAFTFLSSGSWDESLHRRLVHFWAAGVDCCTQQGTFTCGDVEDFNARSGFVFFDQGPPLGSARYKSLTSAAVQAATTFRLKCPASPVFVVWTSDVGASRAALQRVGHRIVEAACMASVVLGSPIVNASWPKIRRHSEDVNTRQVTPKSRSCLPSVSCLLWVRVSLFIISPSSHH